MSYSVESAMEMPDSNPETGPDLQNEDSMSTLIQPNSIDSNSQDSSRSGRNRFSRINIQSKLSEEFTLEDVFQYTWPPDDYEKNNFDQENYIIQEVLANFLQIKSFKRRYPDFSRRVLDAHEREHLVSQGLVSQEFADLGLTGLKSDEVMEMLNSEFPDIYPELTSLFNQRNIQKISDKQKKQYQAARIERTGFRAEVARNKALKSASEFNKTLITERRQDRQYYWDLQTMQIHVPRKVMKLTQAAIEKAKMHASKYPVAVIPGQFTDNYKEYTSDELKYLPLNRALYIQPIKCQTKPPNLSSYNLKYSALSEKLREKEEEEKRRLEEQKLVDEKVRLESARLSERENQATNKNTVPSEQPITYVDVKLTPEEEAAIAARYAERQIVCTVCDNVTPFYVKCFKCPRQGHPKCLTLPDSMVAVVKKYEWACMECKQCMECGDAGEEDLMMFCDRCDRGYHAYCVGLKAIPEGQWECPLCTGRPAASPIPPPTVTPIKIKSTSSSSSSKRKKRGRPTNEELLAAGKTPKPRRSRAEIMAAKGDFDKSYASPISTFKEDEEVKNEIAKLLNEKSESRKASLTSSSPCSSPKVKEEA